MIGPRHRRFETRGGRLLFGLIVLLSALAPAAATVKVPYEWLQKLEGAEYDRDGNHVDDEIDALPSNAVVDVVLALNECATPSDVARFAAFGDPVFQGKFVSTLSLARVTVSNTVLLGRDRQVAFVFLDRPAQEDLPISSKAIKVVDSVEYVLGNIERHYSTLNGSGRVVAVLDNGVGDGVHESLPASKLVGAADCTVCPCGNCLVCPCDAVNPSDQSTTGHGTHVAGIAVGAGGAQGATRGIAPAAGLADIRVMGPNASATTVQRGIEWAIAHKTQWGIDVLNMSLGIPPANDGKDPVSQAVNDAVDAGLVVVTSAGNDGYANYIKPPASADDSIAVAASSYEGDIDRANDDIAAFSNRGFRWSDGDGITEDERKPDIAAPGTDRLPGNTNSSGIISPDAVTPQSYTRRWGTSMSAPHVAGCAALLKQANPSLTPLAIKRLLLDSAEDRGAPGWDTAWGAGLLDCYQAVRRLQTTARSDLGFDVYCNRPKVDPNDPDWWLSTDIQLANPVVEENVANTITVTVKNYSGVTATDIMVRVGVYNFSNSDADYDICLVRIPSLAPNNQQPVSCSWIPRAGGSVSDFPTIHACLKAKTIYGFDSNGANDCAQRNVMFRNVASPYTFPIRVENDTEESLDVSVTTDWKGEASPWLVSLSETAFSLSPDECPRIVTVTMEPRPGTVEGYEKVSVHFTGRNTNGDTVDLGGVQTVHQFENDGDGRGAALDCDDGDPTRWSVPGPVQGVSFDADKTTMRWQPPAETGGTQPVFYDVFRAKAPAGFDPAAPDNRCIVVDQDGTIAPIGEIPAPGGGFYYAVRGGAGCGEGSLGRSTRGAERLGTTCP